MFCVKCGKEIVPTNTFQGVGGPICLECKGRAREREEVLREYGACTFQALVKQGEALKDDVWCMLNITDLRIFKDARTRTQIFDSSIERGFCFPKRCPMYQTWKLLKERGESLKML